MNLVLVTGHMLPPGPTSTAHTGQQSANPLRLFAMIGEWAFNQDAIASFPFDWEALLQANLGIPPATVRRLALTRWELRAGAELTDEDKTQSSLLREYYGLTD